MIVRDAATDDGGVALLTRPAGAPLAFQPLRAAEPTPEGRRLVFPQIPEGTYTAALAASIDEAHYSYRVRAEVRAGADAGPAVLDGRLQNVAVEVHLTGWPPEALLPVFRLERTDDPSWHPGLQADGIETDPMTVAGPDGVLRLRGLGPGRYRLRPLADGYRPQTFEIPGPTRRSLTFVN